ncbi:MAG TPA: ATP-binding protein [Acidimicrobiales bacterium]|nr:ATP-binding protein [Acidimicrobiales bacterium]
MSLSSVDGVVVAVAGGLVLVTVVWVLLSRRAVARRLATLTARMGESDLQFGGRAGLETGLAKLERVVDSTVAVASEANSARSLMEEALAAVPQGIVVGDDQGAVVFQNAPAAELLGQNGAGAAARETVSHLLASAAEGRADRASIDVGGPPPRSLSIEAHPLHDDQRTLGAVVVIEDLSERNRHESVRREFVDNIGQELKRPVGALGLLAETLAAEDDPAVVARLSRRLQNEAQRVSRVVDDLMLLSRMEGEDQPGPEAVPIHLIVAQAAERARGAAQDKEMTVNFGEPAQRLSVMGDRRQLVSAVYNLLDNAVKYSPAGSTVEIRGRQDGDQVELSVRDRGIGIPAAELEHIFERFYRVEGAHARHLGGSGLGLSIVRHVAGNHGGEVRVESTEGEGSTFVLRLPAGPSPAATASSPPPPAKPA